MPILFRRFVRGSVMAITASWAVAAASIVPASATTTATPSVEICGSGPAVVKPASAILTCADNGEQAVNLHWTSWTATTARATGTVTWRSGGSDEAHTSKLSHTSAEITLSQPAQEAGNKLLFTKLTLNVTGSTPEGFQRNLAFDESPVQSTPLAPSASSSQAPKAVPQISAAPSGTLSYANIEGYWIAAGGPNSANGNGYTGAQTAAAITGAESSYEPGIIQPGVDYCGAGADRAGWGLWQITCGNSVPAYGQNFQLLDPWNNAEAAVAKYDADEAAGYNGFDPWSTYTSGSYRSYLHNTSPNTSVTDPGEYVQVNSTPPGTPASPAANPGSTYGPTMPGSQPSGPPPPPALEGGPTVYDENSGNIEVYAAGSDGSLEQDNYTRGGGWSWLNLGGDITGTPSAVYDKSTGHIEIYATGVNGHLYQIYYIPGSGWSGWVDLGGNITGGPKAIYDENNGNLEVYATGVNGHLYQIAYVPGSGWSGWTDLGGSITGSPDVVYDPISSHIEVYATGATQHLYQTSYVPGSGWTAWKDLGGTITGSPSAVYDASDDSLQVYATSTSGAAYQIVWQSGTGWSSWLNLGGDITGSPHAIYDYGMNQMEVYATGVNGPLYQDAYNHNTGWKWTNLGGVINPDPAPFYDPVSGNMEVYAASDTSPSHLYQLPYVPGSGWQSWQDLGGAITTP